MERTSRESVGVRSGSDRDGAEPIVTVRSAATRLSGRTIWQDVNLDIHPGEFVAVLGANGAGKSTLLKAILGLVPLSEGEVRVLGKPARRGAIETAYLPQRRHFDADLRISGREIVRLGLDGDRWGFPLPFRNSAKTESDRRVDEAIRLVGAEHYARNPIGEMSGGEQQRLLIAQALVTHPRLLALDEPLDSLDLANQRSVAGLLRDVAREEGAAVLLVAHDVNPILPMIDTVVYLAGGHVAVGPPEEVITTETLSRLYGAPVEVLRTQDGRLFVVGLAEEAHTTFHPHPHRDI